MNKEMRKTFLRLSFCISIIVGIISCSHREIFFQYHSFTNAEWDSDNPAVFNVKIEDNSQPYDVSIELRNNDNYPFGNIWLFIDYQAPDGKSRTDTIGFDLADAQGKWLGKGLSLYNLSMPYKTSVLYPDTGTYIYSIFQGMQEKPLKGISDIGLKVSKKSDE